MAIKKFKGKQLLKVQWYLRDTGMLYRDDAGNYYLREVLIQDIDQVLGVTEPIEDVNWDEWLSFGGKPLTEKDKMLLFATFYNRDEK